MPVEDYLSSVGSRDLTPVFETKEFSRQERIKVLKKGYALYEKTVLQFRLGKVIGWCVFILCRNRLIFKFARTFAVDGKIGSVIYRALSKKSKSVAG
jgi:L-amino acid N-acyltransferase YncA